tara:strand:+ start:103 stop:498 length:396 start_codon:yes stop_codon:yes gene_type:complete
MATTTAQFTLTSSDLTTDALSLTTTATLTDTASTTGVTETGGLSRKITTSVSEYTLVAEADHADDKAHKIYIKHVGSTASDRVIVKFASQSVGKLYAGDWMFIPWNGDTDVKLTPNVATSVTIEYMVIIAS